MSKKQRIAELERKVLELEERIQTMSDLIRKPQPTIITIPSTGSDSTIPVRVPYVWPSPTTVPYPYQPYQITCETNATWLQN